MMVVGAMRMMGERIDTWTRPGYNLFPAAVRPAGESVALLLLLPASPPLLPPLEGRRRAASSFTTPTVLGCGKHE